MIFIPIIYEDAENIKNEPPRTPRKPRVEGYSFSTASH
jgi:hypothetical protein